MFQEMMNGIPQMLQFLPAIARPLAAKTIQMTMDKIPAETMNLINTGFERWLDAVGRRDPEAIAILFQQYNIPPGGILERFTARLMGLEIEESV